MRDLLVLDSFFLINILYGFLLIEQYFLLFGADKNIAIKIYPEIKTYLPLGYYDK